MKLTNQERNNLRQIFLTDAETNLDRLIVLTEQKLAKKYDEEIRRAKDQISNLIKESDINKEIEDLINKNLLS